MLCNTVLPFSLQSTNNCFVRFLAVNHTTFSFLFSNECEKPSVLNHDPGAPVHVCGVSVWICDKPEGIGRLGAAGAGAGAGAGASRRYTSIWKAASRLACEGIEERDALRFGSLSVSDKSLECERESENHDGG